MTVFQIIHQIKMIFSIILNTVFPKSPKVENIEKMTSIDWYNILKIGEHEGVLYFFPYSNKYAREAIWEIKYRRNKKICENIMQVVSENLLEIISEKETFQNFKDVVVTSIPQSRKRKNERGYNQGEDLGRALARGLNLPFLPLLKKTRNTPRQTTLKRSARISNTKNSFEIITKKDLSFQNIILIDDVVTTGATLNEARKVLENSYKKVLMVSIGH